MAQSGRSFVDRTKKVLRFITSLPVVRFIKLDRQRTPENCDRCDRKADS